MIDFWGLNDNLSVEVQSMNQDFDGAFGIMRLTVTGITVLCAQNFTGSDCTQCIHGLTGSMCNETDDCVNVTCSGHEWCLDEVDSFTCSCDPGFTGAECEDNINECIDPGVNCSDNGQCVDEFGSYSCNCSAGYNGTDCEINVDDC